MVADAAGDRSTAGAGGGGGGASGVGGRSSRVVGGGVGVGGGGGGKGGPVKGSTAAAAALSSVRAASSASISSGSSSSAAAVDPRDASSSAGDDVRPETVTELRREASAILKALSTARAAPGGLGGALGSTLNPMLIGRLLEALCSAGMLYQACALTREAMEAGVRPSAEAMERLVRHGVRAGRPAEVAATFGAYRRAGGAPTLRTYTDLVSALSKKETAAAAAAAGRTGRNGGRRGGAAAGAGTGTGPGAGGGGGERRWNRRSVAGDGSGDGGGGVRASGTAAIAAENGIEGEGVSGEDRATTAVDVWLMLREAASASTSTPSSSSSSTSSSTSSASTAAPLKLDGAAYTAAVGAYMAAGRPKEAERLVREMARTGVTAGPRLYNTLIAAHGRAGDLQGVRAAEQQMRGANVRPNQATHGARVAAYVRCGEMDLAAGGLLLSHPIQCPSIATMYTHTYPTSAQ